MCGVGGRPGILAKLILEPPKGVLHGVPFPVNVPSETDSATPSAQGGTFRFVSEDSNQWLAPNWMQYCGHESPLSRQVAEIFLLLGRRRAVCETLNSYGFYRSVRHIKCCAISSRSNKASFLSSAA